MHPPNRFPVPLGGDFYYLQWWWGSQTFMFVVAVATSWLCNMFFSPIGFSVGSSQGNFRGRASENMYFLQSLVLYTWSPWTTDLWSCGPRFGWRMLKKCFDIWKTLAICSFIYRIVAALYSLSIWKALLNMLGLSIVVELWGTAM